EKGYLTSVELKQIIGEQIEQIVFSLLIWEKGDFEFKESDTPHKGVDLAPINILNLIEDASQRIEEMTVLLKQIPNEKIIFKMADDVSDAGEIKLNANEWRILALVNGQRSVRQLVTDSGYEEFEVYKVLSSLLATGHIQGYDKKPISNKNEVDSYKTELQVDANDILVHTEEAAEAYKKEELPPLENKLTPQKKTENKKAVVKAEPEVIKDEEPGVTPELETVEDGKSESQSAAPPADINISESELSEMVTVYIDILKPIHKILENELGMEAFSIIDDSKRQLNSLQKKILKNFRAENPSASNIHEIIEAIKENPDAKDGSQLVIISFSNLIQKVLLRVPDILGTQPTRNILQEIERVIYHIDNEQSEMIKKTTIIDGIKDILLETERVLSKQ
ncbi:MAG: DUF4388 domain-containing protein, partial [Deltaproteobacteria bacterium]|nr:DUF4388 domain-containing protein [Deltaproteobacteria bacterium]